MQTERQSMASTSLSTITHKSKGVHIRSDLRIKRREANCQSHTQPTTLITIAVAPAEAFRIWCLEQAVALSKIKDELIITLVYSFSKGGCQRSSPILESRAKG